MSREYDHVITVTRIGPEAARATCECGATMAGGWGLIAAWVAAHRRRVFPGFRA